LRNDGTLLASDPPKPLPSTDSSSSSLHNAQNSHHEDKPKGGAPNRPLPPTPDEEESGDRTLVMKRNREGDRSRGGGGDFQRSDSSPGSRPSSVLPDLLTSSPGQRQDKSTSEEVRFIRPSMYLSTSCLLRQSSMRALAYPSSLSTKMFTIFITRIAE